MIWQCNNVVLLAFQIDGVQIAVRLKSEELLSKTDLTLGDIVPMTPSAFTRTRSLSELLSDSADHSASLPVLQPIKISSQDSEDDDVSDDDVMGDDVSDDDIRGYDDSDDDVRGGHVKPQPARPVRPPPKPKRTPEIQAHEGGTGDSGRTVKPKPERPKPFPTSPAASPHSKRKTPPTRPGRPPKLPAEKIRHPTAGDGSPVRPASPQVSADVSSKTPSPPQRPASLVVQKSSQENEGKPSPPQRPASVTRDKGAPEAKPVPPARPLENMEKQTSSILKSNPPHTTDRAKPHPPVRPRGNVEKQSDNVSLPEGHVPSPMSTNETVEKRPENQTKTKPRPSSSVEQTKPSPPARPPRNSDHPQSNDIVQSKTAKPTGLTLEENSDNPTRPSPPGRPATSPHRPPPPAPAGSKPPPVAREKEVEKVKELEGQSSLRKRLGSLKLSRKPQREQVYFIFNFHCLIKREQELHESWQARVYMRVSSTFIAWSNENKSCMRVDKREFTWEFHQLSLMAWSNENKSCTEFFVIF